MRKIVASLSISQSQLPIFIVTTDINITTLCHDHRVMSTSRDQLNFLCLQVFHLRRSEHVLAVPMAQLTLLPESKRVKTAIGAKDNRVPSTTCNSLNSWVQTLFIFVVRILVGNYVLFLSLREYVNLFWRTWILRFTVPDFPIRPSTKPK
jgi:hypothetical protein